MNESVSVTHGGTTIDTNTATEAALRTEMEAPAPGAPAEPPPPAATPDPGTAAPVRDDKGRFVKAPAAEPPAGPPETATPPPPEPGAPGRDPSLPRHNPIARMNQALAQKAEAERRAQALEAELQRLRTGAPPAAPAEAAPLPPTALGAPEPQFEQFTDAPDPYTAYLQAWSRWDRAQALAEARAQWDAERQQEARTQTFQSRLADGRTQHPDFDQVLTEADTLGLQVSAVMQEAIADSPHAADLVYFLATHPEECTQLAEESQLTPVAAAPVMRRLLESHLQRSPAPRAVPSNGTGAAARATVSTAKPPVTPVGSSPVVTDEPPGEAASAAEHARYWNRRLKVPGTK